MSAGLVYRDYELINVSPMAVLNTVIALHLRGFDWDSAQFFALRFPTAASLVHFRLAFEGRLVAIPDQDRPPGFYLRLDASARDKVETLISDLNLTAEVDLVEYVRVVLLSDRDHDRLRAGIEERVVVQQSRKV